MNGSSRVRRLCFFVWLAPVVLASIAVPAGRSDAAEQKVSANTVAEGLKTIQHAGGEVAEYAGEDKAKAEEYATKIQPVWALIEGTIKANDQGAYEAFETAIRGFEAAAKGGDSKQAEEALKGLADASSGYLAKFSTDTPAKQTPAPDAAPAEGKNRTAAAAPAPAGSRTAGAAPEPAPAPDGAPAAAAAEAGDAALARTGPMTDALAAMAGAALALGGLAVIGGAARRPARIG